MHVAQIKKEVADYAALGFEAVATFGCFLGEDYEEHIRNKALLSYDSPMTGTAADEAKMRSHCF